MRIGELAAAAGVPPETIRYYERRQLLPEPERTPNGYRHYGQPSLLRLQFIRAAQSAELTLAEIRRIIALREQGTTPCSHVVDLLENKLADVRVRQGQLAELEVELIDLLHRSRLLDPTACGDDAVCHILNN
jgi:DNA-binding transcriptional MerR regulator